MSIQIGNIVIRRAADVREVLERAIINAESGKEIEDHIFWDMIGTYESRLFGLCIYRGKSDKFIDTITDRYIKAKIKFGMPLLESLKR